MRVVIDADLCQGHLRCYAAAPELFGADEQGHGTVLKADLVTEAEHQAAVLAVDTCPEGAVRLEARPEPENR